MSGPWDAPNSAIDSPTASVGRSVDIGEVFSIIGLAFRRGSPVMIAYFALSVPLLVLQLPTVAFQAWMTTKPDPDEVLAAMSLFMVYYVVLLVGSVVIGAAIQGLARPLRALVINPDSVAGPGEALRLGMSRFGGIIAVNLVVGLIVFAGFCLLLVPGVIAMICLLPAPFLVAATDIEWGAAFGKSYELVTRNLAAMIMFLVLMFVVVLCIAFGSAGINLALIFALGEQGGTVLGSLVGSLLSVAIGFPMWVATTGLNISFELADAGIEPKAEE